MSQRPSVQPGAGDPGFTLVELMVALLLIGVVISSLITLQVGSLQTVTLAKQRQTATAFANQVVEQIRALPYATLSQGLDATDVAADSAWVASGRLKAPWDERVVTSSGQTSPVLNPHVSPARTLEGASYLTRRYVTLPKDSTGADVTTTNDFWLTVVTQWTSAVTRGQTKQVVVRNRVVMPAGCKGTVEHPYAGPCQPFLFAEASSTAGAITVQAPADQAHSLFSGSDVSQVAVILPGIASGVEIEQMSSAYGRAVTGGIMTGQTAGTGQVTTVVRSDVDPATGDASAPAPASVSQPTSGLEQTVSTPRGELLLSPSGVADGRVAGGALVTAMTGCRDLADASLSGSRACGSSWMQPAGTAELTLHPASIGGRDLGSISLGRVAASPTPDRAFAARLTTGSPSHCSGTSGDGCSTAGATRTMGNVVIGGLPTATVQGDQVPAGFAGMVTISGMTETASTEIGVGGATPGTAGRFAVTRAGAVQLWTGAAYETVDLAAVASTVTRPLADTTASFVAPDGGPIQVVVSGSVTIGGTALDHTSGTCEPDSCLGQAQTRAIVVTLDYRILRDGEPVTAFQVVTDLGSLLAKATYRAVPNV